MPRHDAPIPSLALGFMNDDHRQELALLEVAAKALAAGDAARFAAAAGQG